MTSSASFRRFAFAFGTTFAVFYAVAVAKDLALFTVFPSLGVVLAGTHHTRDVADPAMGFLAPAMYWYGWGGTGATGAGSVGPVRRGAPAMGFLAPAMYWYGWAATAALGAVTFGLVAALSPGRWTRAIWPGWVWL